MMGDLPTKTLAAILVQQKKKLVVDEIELPKSLDVGQVLVEFFFSGICGSQIGEIDGVKGPDQWLPHLLGHEASGRVLAIGPGVTTIEPNQFVIAHWRHGSGINAKTPKYRWKNEVVNAGQITTFNRFAVISENRLTQIANNVDLKTAALYGCAVTTGLGAVENKAKIKFGESVVIFGAGGIGLNLIQGCFFAGASEIIAVDRFSNRLDLARDLGATHTIDVSKEDSFVQISNILRNRKADVYIDNTGNPDIISKCYVNVSDQGRVILIGVPKKGHDTNIHTLGLHFGKEITGTVGGEVYPPSDISRYMRLFEMRGVELGALVTEVGSLQTVNELIDGMRNGTVAGRCLIDFKIN